MIEPIRIKLADGTGVVLKSAVVIDLEFIGPTGMILITSHEQLPILLCREPSVQLIIGEDSLKTESAVLLTKQHEEEDEHMFDFDVVLDQHISVSPEVILAQMPKLPHELRDRAYQLLLWHIDVFQVVV